MKRILISILTIALLVGVAFAITYDADYYAARKSWTGAQNNSLDPLYLFMNEVGLILHEEAGTIYYVDNNSGDDADDGLSWDKAFLTITYALAASHTNIATSPNYADRNIIYVRGDDFDEDLTDLAQKTDIIGVGSDDGNKMPRLLGNHTIDAVATGYNYMGCRFINMTFVNQAAANIFTVPTGHHGLEWIGCRFESNSSVLAPTAILVTACNDTRIVGCEFISSVNPLFATSAISFGAGLCQNTDILDNFIDTAIGIVINSSATGLSSRIEGNTIYATTLTIDDNSDVFYIANNTLVSDATFGTSSYDFNELLAAGNILTGSDYTRDIPIIGARYFSVSVDLSSATWNTQAAHEIGVVTGAVRVKILAECTQTVTDAGDACDAELGVAGNTAEFIATGGIGGAAGTDELLAGEIWHTATTDGVGGIVTSTGLIDVVIVGGVDLGYTISGADATGGTIVFHIWWEPISATGAVTAGAGGGF